MKKRKTVLAGIAAAAAVCIFGGCREQRQENPITTVSQSTEDEDPVDTMEDETLPGEGIPSYDVELPEELGSFAFAVWGTEYQLPVSYEEFTGNGWTYDGEEEEIISARSYLENEVFSAEQGSVTVDLMNPDAEDRPVRECWIAGFHVDTEKDEGREVYVSLPCGIALQSSVQEDVTAAYGAPKDRYEQEEYLYLTYQFGLNQTVEFGFENETGLLVQIDLRNLKNPEGDEELEHAVSHKTPMVEAYTEPETPGTDLAQAIVSYDGTLYQLPVPVAVMVEHGWEINRRESDEAVKGLEYGYATLEKDGKRLFGTVWNPSEEAVTVENCFVTSLYGDLDTTKVPITAAGDITLGMPKEEFLAAVHETYELETDEENGMETYTFSADDEQENYTSITVDTMLDLVRGIKVVRNQENTSVSE